MVRRRYMSSGTQASVDSSELAAQQASDALLLT
jgi:hypothetical protein